MAARHCDRSFECARPVGSPACCLTTIRPLARGRDVLDVTAEIALPQINWTSHSAPEPEPTTLQVLETATSVLSSRKMTAPGRTPRTLGVDAETVSRWRSRGLLDARELRSDQLQPGREDAMPPVGLDAAPMLVGGSEDLALVRARSVD